VDVSIPRDVLWFTAVKGVTLVDLAPLSIFIDPALGLDHANLFLLESSLYCKMVYFYKDLINLFKFCVFSSSKTFKRIM